MPRVPRRSQWTDAACYHVMNRGQNRATLFADDQDRRHFLDLLAHYRQRYSVRLFHYCLMDNHFHLLLQLAQPRQLSRLVASLLVAYVRYFQRRYRFVGHVFAGRFKSPAIQVEPYLLSLRALHRAQPGGGKVADAGLGISLVQLPKRKRGQGTLSLHFVGFRSDTSGVHPRTDVSTALLFHRKVLGAHLSLCRSTSETSCMVYSSASMRQWSTGGMPPPHRRSESHAAVVAKVKAYEEAVGILGQPPLLHR